MAGVLSFVAAGLGAAVVPAIAVPEDGSFAAIPFSGTDAEPHRRVGPAGDRALARPARALAEQLVARHAVAPGEQRRGTSRADPPAAAGS